MLKISTLRTSAIKHTMSKIFTLICFCGIFAIAHGSAEAARQKRNSLACGTPKRMSGLIVKGQNFTRGSFPWIVALMSTETEAVSFFCSGTIISPTYVVSGEKFEIEKKS